MAFAPRFPAKTPKKRPFFAVSTFLRGRQGSSEMLMACDLQNFLKSRFFGQKIENSRHTPSGWGKTMRMRPFFYFGHRFAGLASRRE